MPVGEDVKTKFTWLLDDVEVVGTARLEGDDAFNIEPDAEYAYIIALSRGNHPLPWQKDGTTPAIHLETYVPVASQVNHDDFYPISGKPGGQMFQVQLADGTSRDLADGDHVRVWGRWVIDHHPENCKDFGRCLDRGWLRVGQAHMELHPFRWDHIDLVPPAPGPFDTVLRIISLAAPIHEEQYLGDGKWFANEVAGVAGHVFVNDDGSNFHVTMATTQRIDAPMLDSSWAGVHRKLSVQESVMQIGADLDLNQTRSLAVDDTGVTVTASVTAVSRDPNEALPSITLPGLGYSIFQAQYAVRWTQLAGPTVSCIVKPHRTDPDAHIDSIGGVLPDGTPWKLSLDEAIPIVESGYIFYVEVPGADPVRIVVAVSKSGRKYLRTVTDYEIPNNLLSLPTCPP